MLKRYSALLTVIALLVMAAAPAALAGRGGSDRPFEANLSGEVNFAFGDADCLAFYGVETQTEATGNATHMGKVVTSWRHCPAESGYENGRLMITAANGDQLAGYYSDDGNGTIVIEDFEGTGRFLDAEGRVEVFYEVTQMLDESGEWDFTVPWPWKALLKGKISY